MACRHTAATAPVSVWFNLHLSHALHKIQTPPTSFFIRLSIRGKFLPNHVYVTAIAHSAQIRAADLIPLHPAAEPETIMSHSFTALKHTTPPTHITGTTLPPFSMRAARQYPDASNRGTAHDIEQNKLYVQNSIRWLPPSSFPKYFKPLGLTMSKKYKSASDGTIMERNAL